MLIFTQHHTIFTYVMRRDPAHNDNPILVDFGFRAMLRLIDKCMCPSW